MGAEKPIYKGHVLIMQSILTKKIMNMPFILNRFQSWYDNCVEKKKEIDITA